MKKLFTILCQFAIIVCNAQSTPGFQLPATIPVSPAASDIAKLKAWGMIRIICFH